MATQELTFGQTSIGKKVLMAVTGLMMLGFVIVHMLGNLQAWSFMGGEAALTKYAKFLHSLGGGLYIARGVLLLCVGVHIWAALILIMRNLNSRRSLFSRYYGKAAPQAATVFSRTMIFTGPLLGIYIVYHILHLTLAIFPGGYKPGSENVYHNVIVGFSNPIHTSIYVLCMLALGGHLIHGAWSMFQTLGINSKTITNRIKALVLLITGVVVLANISIPLGVLFGLIK